MVKGDPVKDYYAELELPSNATTDDIKKQYRKLALQWHPDRNPGHEAEASERFQAIGAAHEILTDPELRRKYDLSRKLPNSSAPRPNASGRRGNPWSTAAETQWDPPPRRGDPRYTRGSGAPPPPPRPANGGASRYKDFKAPPPNSSAQDTRAHADRLHAAWQATRGGSAPTRRKYNVPPPPPPSGPGPYARPGAATPEDMGRPSAQDFRPPSQDYAGADWQRPPSSRQTSARSGRTGFDPGSPAADEPPASAAAYNNRYSRQNVPHMDPLDMPPRDSPDLPPRGAARSRRSSATDEAAFYGEGSRHHAPSRSHSGDQVPFSEANRERTPYATTSKGERTYFDSDSLRRTASMRDATRVAAQAQTMDDERRQRTTKPYMVYSSASDDSEGSGRASPRPDPHTDNRPDAGRQNHLPPEQPPQGEKDPHAEPPIRTATNGPSNSSPGDAMDIDDPPVNKSSDGPNISMDDFRHVHPFSPETAGAGINNLSDLKSSLPFESRASTSHPLKSPEDPQPSPLDALNPPKPPVPPGLLTKDSWTHYLQKWTSYFMGWNTFNAKVIAHFQDRAIQNQDRERGPAGGMVDGWLGAVGETGTLGGWDEYVRCVDEDERVRTRWNIACERHVQAVERHTRIRKQVMEDGLK